MSNVPDHAPIDEGDGVAAWTDTEGTRHRLHTDPDEAADFMATADAIATGRKSLRVILDNTAFWLEEVTEAGLPISKAASFLHNRIQGEIEALVGLHLADRLKDHVDQILAPYGGDDDTDDTDTTETP